MLHIEDTLTIAAPPDHVFAALRRMLEEPESATIVSRAADTMVADFATKTGLLTFRTRERITFRPPDRIDFEHIRGPFKSCSESFILSAVNQGTQVRHTADFSLKLPLLGDFIARTIVAPRFRALVLEHLRQVKQRIETNTSSA
jgi:ribosome-associated toxin RatA of RatAB toxin-antitoxin module